MLTALTTWFTANQAKIIEFGVMLVAALAIIFAIWFSAHQRVVLAEQVGALKATQVAQAEKLTAANAEIARVTALYAQQAAEIQSILAGARDLDVRLTAIRTESDRRVTTINRHDLGKIGARRPDLLEKRINRASSDLFGRLQGLTQ